MRLFHERKSSTLQSIIKQNCQFWANPFAFDTFYFPEILDCVPAIQRFVSNLGRSTIANKSAERIAFRLGAKIVLINQSRSVSSIFNFLFCGKIPVAPCVLNGISSRWSEGFWTMLPAFYSEENASEVWRLNLQSFQRPIFEENDVKRRRLEPHSRKTASQQLRP